MYARPYVVMNDVICTSVQHGHFIVSPHTSLASNDPNWNSDTGEEDSGHADEKPEVAMAI